MTALHVLQNSFMHFLHCFITETIQQNGAAPFSGLTWRTSYDNSFAIIGLNDKILTHGQRNHRTSYASLPLGPNYVWWLPSEAEMPMYQNFV
jgi:hypothetical protein